MTAKHLTPQETAYLEQRVEMIVQKVPQPGRNSGDDQRQTERDQGDDRSMTPLILIADDDLITVRLPRKL